MFSAQKVVKEGPKVMASTPNTEHRKNILCVLHATEKFRSLHIKGLFSSVESLNIYCAFK